MHAHTKKAEIKLKCYSSGTRYVFLLGLILVNISLSWVRSLVCKLQGSISFHFTWAGITPMSHHLLALFLVCVCVYICIHCTWRTDLHGWCLFKLFSTLIFETRYFLSLELTNSASLVSLPAPGTILCWLSRAKITIVHCCTWLFHDIQTRALLLAQ